MPVSKVARVTLAFWVIKVLATTLGETAGDALSMTLDLGYAVSSLIVLGFFCVTLTAQIASRKFTSSPAIAVVMVTLITVMSWRERTRETLIDPEF
jgi:uncharacterized membrane-anchored protein